jgi:hypothetical protein
MRNIQRHSEDLQGAEIDGRVMNILYFCIGLTREDLFVLSFGVIVTAIFWYGAIRVWSLRPY